MLSCQAKIKIDPPSLTFSVNPRSMGMNTKIEKLTADIRNEKGHIVAVTLLKATV